MNDFITKDIEYLHDDLSEVKVMLPRQGHNREEMSLYDILAYMTRFSNDVYLVKLKDGRYRTCYEAYHKLFEGNTEVEAFHKMVTWFVGYKWAVYVTPPKKPEYMLSCDWESIWGKPNKPRVKYSESNQKSIPWYN